LELCVGEIKGVNILDTSYIFTVSLKDFKELFGTNSNIDYEYLSRVALNLQQKTYSLDKKSNFMVHIQLISFLYFDDALNKQNIKIQFSAEMTWWLFKNFNLAYAFNFKSKYSVTFYNLFYTFKGQTQELSITSLRNISEIKKKYINTSDFKKFVINPSIDEINEKSDIEISYVDVKESRIINAINFTVKVKIDDIEVKKELIDINIDRIEEDDDDY